MQISGERPRTCFVISPIGGPESPVRRHADAVYEFIIQPAVSSFGIKAHRSDHLQKPGSISDEMYARILNDDLCIALLTGHNPNVFYELAIAQAAGKPVIVLAHIGDELPFDIKDLRCVYYDLDPISLCKEEKYAKQVRALIQTLSDQNWIVDNVLPGFASRRGMSDVQFVAKSAEYGPHDKWMSLLTETQHKFDVMGISLAAWRQGENLAKILREKSRADCKIRILLLDPENSCLPHLINVSMDEERVATTSREISDMWAFFRGLSEHESSVEARLISRGCPHMQLTVTDHAAVAIPYLYSAKTGGSPLLACSQVSSLYASLSQEFDILWAANEPLR